MGRRHDTSRVAVGLAAGLLVWGGPGGITARADEPIRVTTLARDGRLLVSFEVPGGYTDEIRDAIRSGLPTTFTYEIELRRPAPFWPDRTLAASTVSASVRYDSLTNQYDVARMVDGRVESSRVDGDEDLVQQLLTRFERLPLFRTDPLEVNGEYHLRVRARTRPRTVWFLWPWDRAAAAGASRFTFLE